MFYCFLELFTKSMKQLICILQPNNFWSKMECYMWLSRIDPKCVCYITAISNGDYLPQ